VVWDVGWRNGVWIDVPVEFNQTVVGEGREPLKDAFGDALDVGIVRAELPRATRRLEEHPIGPIV
jgi:hypothetical protein